jgi:predicted membrane-bound spermidine synthase
MQIENILSLLGVISVAGSYVVLLLGVGVIDSESGRSLYLLGGVIGVLIGMGLMGFAKLIRTQAQSLKQLEDIVKLTRVQVRHLDEMRKAAVGEVAAASAPTADNPPTLVTKVNPTAVKPAPKQPVKPA